MALVTCAGTSAGTSTVSEPTIDIANRFGDIPSNIILTSKQAVRRNWEDTGFEAYSTDLQTIIVRVRSSDYAGGLTKGTVVYIGGATGNRPYVLKADADLESTSSKTFGILAEDIAANGDGLCAVEGVLTGLDLRTSNGWADGDSLWLSTTAGEFTKTVPAEPAHSVFIGTITRAHPDLGTIVIQIQNGFELTELHGVLITDPEDGDVLTYETSSTLWKNKPPSVGSEMLASFYADHAVSDATETDVMPHTVASGKMATNGDVLRGEYSGSVLIIGDSNPGAALGIQFAGATFSDISGDVLDDGDWNIRFTIVRVSSTSARISVVATYVGSGGLETKTSYDSRTTGIDWTGTEEVALYLSANEFTTITASMGYIEYVPA